MTAIRQVWPNAQVDARDPAGVWGTALVGLNSDQLRHGVRQLSYSSADFPPTPGKFRELCMTFRRDEAPEPQRITDDSAKARALKACRVAFAVRVCGEAPSRPAQTDFDVAYTVTRTRLPKSSSLLDHQDAWDELYRNFEADWH